MTGFLRQTTAGFLAALIGGTAAPRRPATRRAVRAHSRLAPPVIRSNRGVT